jgi:lipopolysaccharide biosynthesis regulator YciM
MNFAELDEEDDNGAKVLMMDTYDRLLRLRSILEYGDNEPIPKHELMESMKTLKKDYLDLVPDVLIGYMNLHTKKEKASLMLSIIDKFGNKDVKYVEMLSQLVEQFDKDERITAEAEELKEKTNKMLAMRNVFSLCKDAEIMSAYMCFLCLDRPVNMFIDPCGHVICEQCSTKSALTTHMCPFCRGSVRQYRKMFLG